MGPLFNRFNRFNHQIGLSRTAGPTLLATSDSRCPNSADVTAVSEVLADPSHLKAQKGRIILNPERYYEFQSVPEERKHKIFYIISSFY